jgi:putative PIN family toxin of toxin-antitoxin system
MRVVLDTNILARSFYRLTGPAAEVLERVAARPHVLILSAAMLMELARVLDYPRFRRFHKLGAEEIAEFIVSLRQMALVLDPPADEGPAMDDPGDRAIVAAAIAGRANVICTLDRHFYQGPVRDYCRERMIEILDDIELLRRLREAESQA